MLMTHGAFTLIAMGRSTASFLQIMEHYYMKNIMWGGGDGLVANKHIKMKR